MSSEEKNNRKTRVWRELSSSLIGLEVEVKHSSSEDLIGIKGTIEKETSNLLGILSKNKLVWIPKLNQIFRITLSDGTSVLVEGFMIKGTPEVRIKKKTLIW